MECRSRKAKKQFLTRADAERQVQNAKKSGLNLYAYKCSCSYWHLATVKKAPKPAEITSAEWRHIKNRVADLGRQIAADELRAAKKKVRDLAPVIAEDKLWLERMRDAEQFHRECADALKLILDAHWRNR